MTFEQATHFAETWGLVLLGACFTLAVLYALWPSNRDQFARAARAPLNDGDDDDR